MEKVPYHRRPEDMPLDIWQSALRRQFAADRKFKIKNMGTHPVYSDFEVFNSESGNTYKVSIRDNVSSYNFCSCPDFTITALGTCKHIEYMLQYFSKYKKYGRYLQKPYVPAYASLSIFYGKERKVRLKKAAGFVLPESVNELFDGEGFLKPDMTGALEGFINAAQELDPTFRVYPDVITYLERYHDTLHRQRICREIFSGGLESPVFKGLIRGNLYPYQKEGVQKIVEAGRVLIADEMGLGKTLQAIAATEILARFFGVKQVLIFCPVSVKYQWKYEIEKFTHRKVLVVEGLVHKRKAIYMEDSFYKILSFGLCLQDLKIINGLGAGLVILDEAQRIKNWKTQTAQAVKKLDSTYAFVLTGTPVENRIEEIHSILEFVDRYKLGPLFRFLHRHQLTDVHGRLKGYKDLRSIHESLAGCLIRRTKKEIRDQLPGRMDKHFFVELTPEQRSDHDGYYDVVSRLVSTWIRRGYLTDEEQQKLLITLGCMRMVCDSTYILDQKSNHGNKIGELELLLEELLENPENKIVIFSQWKRMLELVTVLLDKRKIKQVILTGSLSAKERGVIIGAFRDDPEIRVFLSTDAGGVGVNLQTANILINLDIPWNPAVLEQRIGRIYRLGQKQHIQVFNFIAKDSIEHRILFLLDFKKTVFTGVIDEEGQDMVMREGFMESVRALTEVSVDEMPAAGVTLPWEDPDLGQEFDTIPVRQGFLQRLGIGIRKIFGLGRGRGGNPVGV